MTYRRGLLLCLFCIELQASPLIMSHRAGMGHFSQASPAAIQHSVALGVDFIELDLRLSADDVPIVHHDPDIDPRLCTYHDGSSVPSGLAVASLPLTQLKSLRCGLRANPQFPEQRPMVHQLLTLQETLAFIAAQDAKINLMLELKSVGWRRAHSFVRAVLITAEDSGLSHRINFQSKDLRIIALLKQIARWRKMPLITDIVAAPADMLTPRRVALLQRLGKRVVAFTVNKQHQWEQLLQAGVDGFITDYPRTLQEFLDRHTKRLSQSHR